MKKVLIIEDNPEWRSKWMEFFENHPELDAEIEIPKNFSSIEEISKKVFETLQSDNGYVLFDNDIRGFANFYESNMRSSMGADIFYRPLCNMGFGMRIAMSSSNKVDYAVNIPKGGEAGRLSKLFNGKVEKKSTGSIEYYTMW